MWECTQCGRCCKLKVHIDDADVKTLKTLGYKDFSEEDTEGILLKKKNGACLFLLDDKRCGIQVKHGYDKKPKICRRFPLNKFGVNQIVCGKFSGNIESENTKIKEFEFIHKGKKISSDVFAYALSKLGDDYLNHWYSLLKGIKQSKNISISKSDIDYFFRNLHEISKTERVRLSIILGAYSKFIYFSWITLATKSRTNLRFPCENITLDPKEYSVVELKKAEIIKFLKFLAKGNGILYKENYSQHLLFCFMFLERFSRQIAYNNGRKNVEFIDIVNAFSILNSAARF